MYMFSCVICCFMEVVSFCFHELHVLVAAIKALNLFYADREDDN